MSQSRMWCFTIHGERADLEALIEAITAPKWGRYGICQLEKCPTTHRYHIQGFLVLPRAQRLSFVKGIHSSAHWEAAKGSLAQNEDYCQKELSRAPTTVPKQWGERPENQQGRRADLEAATALLTATEGTVKARMKRLAEDYPAVVVKHYKGMEYLCRLTERGIPINAPEQWYEWQAALLAHLDSEEAKADDRSIVWVTDPAGGNGKSTVVRYLVANCGAVMLNGKIADMAHAYDGQSIVVFDVTRTQLEHMDHLYSFAESLKNGIVFSTKYESGMKIFKSPRVVFFANTTYARGKWTEDRVHEILISSNSSTEFFSQTPAPVQYDYTAGGLPTAVETEAALLQAEYGGHREEEIIEID